MISHKKIRELQDYAEMILDEYGELCLSLIHLAQQSVIGEELEKIIEKEIDKELANIKEHTEIVEETITPKPYISKYLEWG